MTICRLSAVSKHFGGNVALDSCSFGVESGKITGLIGPNGSGKTTVFNLISRFLDCDKGRIFFSDIEISRQKDFQVARSGISRTFQEVRLFNNLTIKENFEMAANFGCCSADSIQCNKNNDVDFHHILTVLNLHKPVTTIVSELSYGERKILDVACAICRPHILLMLDEPVAGLTHLLRKKITAVLLELKQRGSTILIIEHDMNFIMGIADSIVVLDAGKVIAQGTPNQIRKNPEVLSAYLGGN